MQRLLLKSKIHRAMVTDAIVDYEGSIEIPRDMMDEVGLWPGEKVLIGSATSGNRLETYVLEGAPGTRKILVNGGAALLIGEGERITIMAFAWSETQIEPQKIVCDEENNIIRRGSGQAKS